MVRVQNPSDGKLYKSRTGQYDLHMICWFYKLSNQGVFYCSYWDIDPYVMGIFQLETTSQIKIRPVGDGDDRSRHWLCWNAHVLGRCLPPLLKVVIENWWNPFFLNKTLIKQFPKPTSKWSSWWLNQPMYKIVRQIGSFPPGPGMKRKIIELPPPRDSSWPSSRSRVISFWWYRLWQVHVPSTQPKRWNHKRWCLKHTKRGHEVFAQAAKPSFQLAGFSHGPN